jgi:hypothetical protein
MPAHLLRAPPLTEQLGHQDAGTIADVDSASMIGRSPRSSPTMGLERLISATGWSATSSLPRCGRCCSAEPLGDGAQAQSVAVQVGDLGALTLGQELWADLAHC